MDNYRPRITDKVIDFKLHAKGAVVIDGPKWCGKTTSAKRFAKSVVDFGDTEKMEQHIKLASISPSSVIEGETPRLFDEWQEVPALWDALRYEIDRRNKVGQFILTGSSIKIPKGSADDPRHHSGTGRFSYVLMRPMALAESGESNAKVSLKELFETPEGIAETCDLSLEELAFLTCRGGWPFATLLEGDYALSQAEDYYGAIVNEDISRVDRVKRDPRVVKKLLRSYAREIGQSPSIESITRDVLDIGVETVSSYINALRKIYVVEDAPAWNPNLRSKTAIRTSDTRYFVDPSIATASLGMSPSSLMGDLNYFGFVFESLVFRDLRVYLTPLNGSVYHYRDKNGLECDAVAVLPDGRYGLIEIKLGQSPEIIAEASETLITLAKKIDTDKMNEPSFMAIITGNGAAAYREPETGIYIVPIGSLGA